MQDVRFLPNPFFVEGLKTKTGLSGDVADYVKSNETYDRFFPMLLDFFVNLIPLFEREGKELPDDLHRVHRGQAQVAGARERAGGASADHGL